MNDAGRPAVKDPLPPEHRRFVLGQATLRYVIFATALAAIGAWLLMRG